ncbi:TolC family protein, partial [candidate division WOR-3 bacterium]|nr:TolC family protein [candidate division WOR-3 bacterium]
TMLVLLNLVVSVVLSLSQAESLAVSNSFEMRAAREKVLSARSQYRSQVYKFIPELSLRGYVPRISYSSNYTNYPPFPEPLKIWTKTEEGVLGAHLSALLPTGADAEVSYELSKVNQTSNIYSDENYYQGNVFFTVSQPILGNFLPRNEVKYYERKYERELRNLERTERNVLASLRANYVDLFILQRARETYFVMESLASRQFGELEHLYRSGYVEEVALLRDQSRLGLIILKKLETDSKISQCMEELALLTGEDSFTAIFPDMPVFSGEITTLGHYELRDIEDEIEDALYFLEKDKSASGISLDFQGYYGLNGRDEETYALYDIEENRWGIAAGITIPLFHYSDRERIKSLEFSLSALRERKKGVEDEVQAEKRKVETEVQRMMLRFEIAKSTFEAAEKALLRTPWEMTSPSEQLSYLQDYTDALEAYGVSLKELFILDLNYKKRVE